METSELRKRAAEALARSRNERDLEGQQQWLDIAVEWTALARAWMVALQSSQLPAPEPTLH